MSDQEHAGDSSRFAETSGLTFRGIQGESDYPLLLAVNSAVGRLMETHDRVAGGSSPAFAPSEKLTRLGTVLIASPVDEAAAAVGYSRLAGIQAARTPGCTIRSVS